MILIIDLNPILESIYNIEKLKNKIEVKSRKTIYNPGGSGLNAGQIIKKQGLDIFSIGFLGGIKGEYIFQLLKNLNIYNDFTFIQDETKAIIKIIENDKVLSIIHEESPKINRTELRNFYKVYNNILEDIKFVCGLGELPIGIPPEIYFDLIQIAKENNKNFILDVKDEELLYGIEAKPYMVKIDKEGLEDFIGLKISSEREIISIAYSIVEKGIELVVVDLKEKGSIILNEDHGYRLKLPNKNIGNIGKDYGYTVAGYSIGISKEYDVDTIMKLGQSMRIAYGIEKKIDKVNMTDIKKIMSNIEIRKINY